MQSVWVMYNNKYPVNVVQIDMIGTRAAFTFLNLWLVGAAKNRYLLIHQACTHPYL